MPKTTTKKTTKKKTAARNAATGKFSAEERAAMRERAAELKAEKNKADGEATLLAKVADMPTSDRTMAKKLHAIVKANAPDLMPKTWYGQPAWARDGQIICFFQPAEKFGSRYPTLGFNDPANLDDGTMWPTAFALTEWNDENESTIRALVAKAAS